jgi:prevent-host-death family protein
LFERSLVLRTVGIFEAKQKLSELVERASRGERIRITRRGKVAAEIGPAQEKPDLQDLKEAFAKMDEIRKRAKPLPRGVTIKDLIEEGRM